MPVRTAEAVWEGNLKDGDGKMKLGSGAFEGNYSFGSRFEENTGTNPEELIGAAIAGCFSMALSHSLAQEGYSPKRVNTSAKVRLEKVGDNFKIVTIELKTKAVVPDIEENEFLKHAETTKKGCPVSQALTGTDIKLHARLVD